MVDFDHLGYDLNRCGGFLDGIQNLIQTCLHHTVLTPVNPTPYNKCKTSVIDTNKKCYLGDNPFEVTYCLRSAHYSIFQHKIISIYYS